MNNLQVNGNNPFEIFDYLDKGGVRMTRDGQGEPWFCLNDICTILEIKNPWNVVSRVPNPCLCSMEVWVQTGVKTDGTPATRLTKMNFVNESGLYYAIGKSTKPEAEKFREWLYVEVIPSIRQNGYYALPQMTEMEMINKISSAMIDLQGTVSNLVNNQTDVTNRLTELEFWQAEVKQIFEIYGLTGHVSVRGYAIMNNIPINNNQAKYLGGEATKLAQSRGLEIKSIPDPRYGVVNGYPKIILDEVFSTYLPQLRQS